MLELSSHVVHCVNIYIDTRCFRELLFPSLGIWKVQPLCGACKASPYHWVDLSKYPSIRCHS